MKNFRPALKCTFLSKTKLSIKSCISCNTATPNLRISTCFLLSELDPVTFSTIKESFLLHILRDWKSLIVFSVCSLASTLSIFLLSSKLPQVESIHLKIWVVALLQARCFGNHSNDFDDKMV